MSKRTSSVVNTQQGGRKAIIVKDFDEDERGRRKKSKSAGQNRPAVDLMVDSDHRFNRSNVVEAMGIEEVPAEPEYVGFEMNDDDFGLADDTELGSGKQKTPNDLLQYWLDNRCDQYLAALFHFHAAPTPKKCHSCDITNMELYRCSHCLGNQHLCSECMVSQHQSMPTHRISRWNGGFWEDDSLHQIGLVIHLGHSGKPCDLNMTHKQLLVGDTSGFYHINVHYCTHDTSPPPFAQLLSLGLFPCSDTSPKSAFTIACLDHFDIFATKGATSGQRYYEVLVKLTNPGFPDNVNDRYRELHLTHRRYCHLKNLKRSGATYDQHHLEERFGDHAVQCVACPAPRFNYDPDKVPEELRPYTRTWMSYDGGFASSRKAKKVDKNDICLSDGLQYYVANDPYEEWAKAGGKERVKGDRPECDNHKAGRSDTYGTWGGLDVTGMGLLTCTRHTCALPKGLVDFYAGEKFRYGDYAFGAVVNDKTRRGPHTFGMTYDIWCQWIINLKKRALEFPDQVSLPPDLDLIGGIPKWHLVGHQCVCHIRYSLNYLRYCGQMDGEGCERFWAFLNMMCGSTSEKGPGFRRDSVNNIIDCWNFAKMIGMYKHLVSAFEVARKMYLQQRSVFEELHTSLPEEKTREWSEEEIEAVPVGDSWESPLYETETPAASFPEKLRAERGQESQDSHDPSRRIGAARWVASGIELEHQMQKVRKLGADIGKSMTDTQFNLLSDKKAALSKRLSDYQQKTLQYMNDVGAPNHPERREVSNAEPENAELGLPSSYSTHTVKEAGLVSMVNLEVSLRRATCDDALQSLRDLLGVKAMTLKYKKKNLSGEHAITRAESKLKEHNKKIAAVQWRYNNSRAALFRLGAPQDDLDFYQEVTRDDLIYLKVYLDEESGKVGDGSRSIPWLWRTSKVSSDDEGWQISALKIEWFRSRGRYQRWEEELKHLKRDMLMSRNSFRSLETIWRFKSEAASNSPGMSEYAAKKSHFYKNLGSGLYNSCAVAMMDPVVEFDWDDGWEAD